jgi:hypothetical protein
VFRWNGIVGTHMFISGQGLHKATNLRELHMDGVAFYNPKGVYDRRNPHASVLGLCSHFCKKLERVSLAGARWGRGLPDRETFAVADEMLADFVRRTPPLRWLRSDLSDAAVARLREQRPDVEFVGA